MNAEIPDSSHVDFDRHAFLTYRLAGLQNQLNAQATRVLGRHADITLTEWRLLLLISVFEKSSMAEITRDAAMDKGQVSRAVKSLEQKGYLATQADRNDARARVLKVTAEGLALKNRMLPRMERRQQRLTRDISAEDLAAMQRVLDALEDAARIDDF